MASSVWLIHSCSCRCRCLRAPIAIKTFYGRYVSGSSTIAPPDRIFTTGCQPGGEFFGLLRLAVTAHAPKDKDLARLAVGQKKVSVGRRSQQTGISQVRRIQFYPESLGSLRPRVLGPRNHARRASRAIVHRGSRVWLWQVGHGEIAPGSWPLLGIVGEGGLPGEGRSVRRDIGPNRGASQDERR